MCSQHVRPLPIITCAMSSNAERRAPVTHMSCITLRQKFHLPLICLLRQYQFPRCVCAAVQTYTLYLCRSKSPQDNVLTLYCHLVKPPKTLFERLIFYVPLDLFLTWFLRSTCFHSSHIVAPPEQQWVKWKQNYVGASSQTWNDFKIVFTILWLGTLTMPPMWLWHSAPGRPDTRLRSFWLPAQHPLA